MKLAPYARRKIRETAEKHEAELGSVPSSVIRQLAVRYDVSPRTIRRRIAGTGKDRPSAFAIVEEHLVAIRRNGGIKEGWKALGGAAGTGVSYETFARAYRTGIPKGVRVGIKTNDESKMLAHLIFARFEVAHRNMSWVFDHGEFPVTVLGARGRRFKPWVTLAEDECSRLIMSASLSDGQPTSDVGAAVIGDGIMGRLLDDGTFIGGKPDRMRWDRGADWLSNRLTQICLELDILADPCEPYAGWQKGKVERLIKTAKMEFCPSLPGYEIPGPIRSRKIASTTFADDELLTFDEFAARFAAWVQRYNLERAHSALGGRTPCTVWKADERPLEQLEDEELRPLFLRRAERRTVTKNGIRFKNIDYVHSSLIAYVGRSVLLGYRDGDEGWVDVYDENGKWICTAKPAKDLSAGQRAAIGNERERLFTLVQDVTAAADLGRARAVRRERAAEEAEEAGPTPEVSPALAGGLAGRGIDLLVGRRAAPDGATDTTDTEKEVA